MNLFPRKITIFVLLFFLSHKLALADFEQKIYTRFTDKPLQSVLEDIEFAITEKNLRITGRLHIGKAIRERGNKEFPDFEIIMYCSIRFAEEMLMHAPENITACPGRITVRSTEKGYLISATLWPEDTGIIELRKNTQNMNNLVRHIVDFAAEDWSFIYEK